jgi:hypothetical protein
LASGQRVNMDKSSIFFSKGCTNGVKNEVKGVLDVHNETLNEKYLGMLMDVGHSRGGAFKYIKDRIWSKVQGWLEKLLSAGGKDVLIKSFTHALLIFSMACFLLPCELCQHINSISRKFWWGCRDGERKPSWVSWREMCKPKHMGGLGFRDIELFNLALLARQGWCMLQKPESLNARVLKARYYLESDLLVEEVGSSPSQVGRAIHAGIGFLKQGLIRRIGTGENTNPLNDHWISRDGLLRPMACLKADPPARVSDFIEPMMAKWKEEKLREFMQPMDVEIILQIPLSGRRQADIWAWHYDSRGAFSVHSTYRMLVSTRE